jgi:FKBP-type peptidyl-prolyl cis-trans isomerase SlyD
MTDDADAEEEAVDEAEVESEEVAEEEESEGLQNGDFVRLEYTVRTVEDGTVVDTTSHETAEEAGIDDDDHDFSPRTIVVGAGHVFEAVDHALVGDGEGDEATVEIPAAEAFGEFDPDDVRTVSVDKIDEDDRYPGAQVQIDGEQGHLETVIGGRARVDFNHPLAGETLEYDYEIVDVVEDRLEKARGVLGIYLQEVPDLRIDTAEVEEEIQVEADEDDDEDADPTYETETTEKETLYIDATPQMTMNQRWMFQKQQIAGQLVQRLGVDRVVVEEVLDGGGGMMGGMGGMMGGMGGGAADDVEEALAEADVDTDEIVEEIESADE